MENYSYELRIPVSRVAVLIGVEGSVKKRVERETGARMTIDSKEGEVFLSCNDALGLYSAREIVTAIGRGFNPEIALQLLKPDYSFEQFSLSDYAKTRNHLIRIKGRIIGSNGKSRELMEEFTECRISVFGKTISIIGRIDSVGVCRRAVESLIAGSRHATVYRFLERRRRELKKREFLG